MPGVLYCLLIGFYQKTVMWNEKGICGIFMGMVEHLEGFSNNVVSPMPFRRYASLVIKIFYQKIDNFYPAARR